MMFFRGLGCAVIALSVSSCAVGTGVLPAGPHTYTVSEQYAPIRGGIVTSKQVAYTEANDKCTEEKRSMVVLDTKEDGPALVNVTWGVTRFTMTFRCDPVS